MRCTNFPHSSYIWRESEEIEDHLQRYPNTNSGFISFDDPGNSFEYNKTNGYSCAIWAHCFCTEGAWLCEINPIGGGRDRCQSCCGCTGACLLVVSRRSCEVAPTNDEIQLGYVVIKRKWLDYDTIVYSE